MLDGEELRFNLETLSSYYRQNRGRPLLALMIAKLAVLELSGWIEECAHDLARSSVLGQNDHADALSLINKTIGRTHGVSYEKHIQPILSVALGASRLIAIEHKLSENATFDVLKSELGTVHKFRNSLAHTFTRGTPRIDSPEITLRRFDRILNAFGEFNKLA